MWRVNACIAWTTIKTYKPGSSLTRAVRPKSGVRVSPNEPVAVTCTSICIAASQDVRLPCPPHALVTDLPAQPCCGRQCHSAVEGSISSTGGPPYAFKALISSGDMFLIRAVRSSLPPICFLSIQTLGQVQWLRPPLSSRISPCSSSNSFALKTSESFRAVAMSAAVRAVSHL